MDTFSGKLILITGGSSGIGLALAKKFVRAGANVHILAREQEKLRSALDILEANRVANQQNLGMIAADVSKFDQIQTEINNLCNRTGIPDYLINSAGVVHPGEFQNLEIEKFHWMMNINFFGTVNAVKAIIPFMIQRSAGHIINISSMAGFLGVYGYSAYSASKFAVRGFTDVIRSELKRYHIRVSLVFPPDTQTPQLEYEQKYKPEITKELTATSGLMQPDQVAESIIKGIRKKQYIITPGLEATLFYTIQSISGNLVYKVMDVLVAQAQRKISNQHTTDTGQHQ
ncbi:MAG: SDR family oxidoreductase [Anaerolineae bacterium]|nr:SDR family oxidoreductase [Anaerolineae bacterium]